MQRRGRCDGRGREEERVDSVTEQEGGLEAEDEVGGMEGRHRSTCGGMVVCKGCKKRALSVDRAKQLESWTSVMSGGFVELISTYLHICRAKGRSSKNANNNATNTPPHVSSTELEWLTGMMPSSNI